MLITQPSSSLFWLVCLLFCFAVVVVVRGGGGGVRVCVRASVCASYVFVYVLAFEQKAKLHKRKYYACI